ncbi:HNH endonuclease [bacterium]|nr:HNH endonuclease [bacterium]
MQQDKRDIYEPKVHINEDDLVTSKCQIDHIIPISISGIDSLDNKVLTFSTKNRNKDNNIPKDFLLGKD